MSGDWVDWVGTCYCPVKDMSVRIVEMVIRLSEQVSPDIWNVGPPGSLKAMSKIKRSVHKNMA